MYICKYSGLMFSDSIFESTYNYSFPCAHPIFDLNFKSLVNLANDALADPHETAFYLIGLALLKSTRTEFRKPVDPSANQVIITNFQKLLTYSIGINNHANPDVFPKFIIDADNSNLDSLEGYLHSIKTVFQDLEISAIENRRSKQLNELEHKVDTMIKRRLNFKPKAIAKVISDWASMAAQFPDKPFYYPDGSKSTLDMYWKSVIHDCFIEDHLAMVGSDLDLDDLADLIDWCEQYIPHGSTHAAVLMSKLRRAYSILEEFRIVPIKNQTRPILVPDLNTLESMLFDEPARTYEIKTELKADKPDRKNYKSTVEYLKALSEYSRSITYKSKD